MTKIERYIKQDGTKAFMFNAYVGKHPRTGRNVYRKRQGFKTKKQAQIALAKLINDIDENGILNEKKIMTFDELYLLWFNQIKLDVKGSTANSYKRWYKTYIKDYIGELRIDKLNVMQCQKFVNDLRSTGIKSYRQHRNLANQILRFAEAMELISSNPMSKTIVPRKNDDDDTLKFYTKAELEFFFRCLQDDNRHMRFVFFRVLAFTGMRKGEVLALTWKDIDFNKKMLSIDKTVTRDIDGNKVIEPPKTKESIRDISVDDETLKILKKWRMIQREEYFQKGFNTSVDSQFIFTNDDNTFFHGETVTTWLNRVIKKYNLPVITPHHLRHTHASLLLQAGVPIKEVAARLGHADTTITDRIYSHVMPEEKEKTAEKFANFVGF